MEVMAITQVPKVFLIDQVTQKRIAVAPSTPILQQVLPHLDLSPGETELTLNRAYLEYANQQFYIKDPSPKSETLVNGVKIQAACLNSYDLIQLGTLSFYFSPDPVPDPLSTLSTNLSSKNPFWNKQLQRLPQLAITNHPMLILGPSGSGKEEIANLVHRYSCRRHGPLVRVNCSALSETLIESELFGHIKGSFTGAIANRKGAFETARGGTLFLDEIGDLPFSLQAKLLRAIENNEIRPVGSDRTIKTNVRIIAATHKNLAEKVLTREFRQDLYYRLNVVHIHIPSLVDRTEDFEDLLFSLCRQYRVRFSPTAIKALKNHSWPGNIRELKNVVLRAQALFAQKTVQEDDLPQLIDQVEHPLFSKVFPEKLIEEKGGLFPALKLFEKEMILKTLLENRGNQRKTAKDLGIPKSTLHDRLKSYGLKSS
ncbi:MAG: sigma-54 dependent transcriptional regulator [Bdellovibrionaceae bacterium]|nr:sigma-54 dependent transcriptional regulator [Pseudobdellovibrionaceae bacterium]MDW8189833.1 sigma 54-interacting transcriptional regulator [Pseudobdellovibrionaceae bacterium]